MALLLKPLNIDSRQITVVKCVNKYAKISHKALEHVYNLDCPFSGFFCNYWNIINVTCEKKSMILTINLSKKTCQIFSILASTRICQKAYLFSMLRLPRGELGKY